MKKILSIVLIAILAIAACNTAKAQAKTIFGVSLEMPASDFAAELSAKADDIAAMARAKKCKIKVNENIPGAPASICHVKIMFDYRRIEIDEAYTMLRSILNSKYGENKERTFEYSASNTTKVLFWRTPFGEIALHRSCCVYIYNYDAINAFYSELSDAL